MASKHPDSLDLPGAAISALQQGKMIEAIKIVRESTGMGLKEAKDFVDSYINSRPELRTKFATSHSQANLSRLLVFAFLSALITALVFWLRKA